ncbi:MAG: phosphomannomutase/phosphoglucomutase [Gammaproteobacteria bacterium]
MLKIYKISPTIFRAYDIRGVVGTELTADGIFALGLALGNAAQEKNQKQFIVGRDGRLSSPEIAHMLIDGILESGCEVIDVGMVPTPVLYFATQTIGTGTGVMVTGSHNPKQYNGFKMLIAGDTLYGDAIQALYQRIVNGNLVKDIKGSYSKQNVQDQYLEKITTQIQLKRPLKIVIDSGNGVTGNLAPRLFEALGCNVIPLYCEIDGHFPNHHPDPMVPKNLEMLIKTVKSKRAHLGLAFDGDGDRLGLVTNKGEIIWPDRQLMLFAQDILSRHPGAPIIYDVKCTHLLKELISNCGGKPIMSQTGHSLIKAALKRENAPLAGEMSGHIFFNDNWYGFDDALYSAARLLDLIAAQKKSVSAVFAQFPEWVSTPEITVPIAEEKKFAVIQALQQTALFPDAEISTIDGIRADFVNGWGLVRASNTTASLICRFEANDEQTLSEIQELFRTQILAQAPELELPF